MPIFEVTIQRTMLVVADNDDQAGFVARSFERESCKDYHADVVSSRQIATQEDIPKGWIGSLPYGGDDSTRVEQYIAAAIKPA